MDSDDQETISDAEDVLWASNQRSRVIEYLHAQNVDHAGVSLEPRWFLSLYVAIWAVRSKANPDRIGWWAISGDLPTDYLSCGAEQDDADVLLSFSQQWKTVGTEMAAGRRSPHYAIGPAGREKELAPLLLSRAEILEDFAKKMKASE